MVGMMSLIVFLNIKNTEEIRTISYIDDSHQLGAIFKDNEFTKYINLEKLGFDKAKEITLESYYGFIYIPQNDQLENLSKGISFYSEDAPNLTIIKDLEYVIERRIRDLKIEKLNFDIEKIKGAETDVAIATETFAGEKSSKMGSILKMIAGGAFGYLIFMFIIIYGTSVMRSVIEEKTSRIIEVIISSVKPFELMLGKILGNAFAGILQFIIWIISASLLMIAISSFFGVDLMASSPSIQTGQEMVNQVQQSATNDIQAMILEIKNLPLMTLFLSFIVYFFGGYLIYSSIYAAIGAAVDNETDTQQFMMPVMIPLMIAIYVGFGVIENPHGSIAVAFSIFPLTSPIVMLMRIPFGVPWYELLISMALLLVTFIGIVWFAAKIYRVGILMYGKKPSYKDLYKWLKY